MKVTYKYITIILLILVIILPQNLFAATAESINKQINDVNLQIQALDKEIKQYQDQISATNEESNTLSNIIKELTLTRNKLLTETKQTEKKIVATGLVINTLDSDISTKEKSISNSTDVLNKMLRELREWDDINPVVQIISQNNIGDSSREYNNIVTLNESIRKNINDIKKQREDLIATKGEKEDEKKNLSTLKKTLDEKKVAVDLTKKEKDSLLKDTKSKESNYKILLADRVKRRDLFEKDLENYEAQLKFILNPSLLPDSGVLSWPLDKIFVTQLFGKTVAAKRLYVSGSHSGVDFRASIGTPVKSMGSGTVIGTGDTDDYCRGASFGKWVFIKYDNGLSSTFGHLSYISATAGQRVSVGETVALSGNTGHSTGPHLHVAVYASQGADVKTVPSLSCNGKTFTMPIAPVNAYLDPMLYLPKLLPGMLKNDTPRD